jgi:vacuolar protein sorting-associated protein 45
MWQGAFAKGAPRECIVFIVGGSTYEEAKAVADWNEKSGGAMRVILGGTAVLNSAAFMDALTAGFSGPAPKPAAAAGGGDAEIDIL